MTTDDRPTFEPDANMLAFSVIFAVALALIVAAAIWFGVAQ